ncbi:hypothetical protein [Parasediminibacterium sp. JCM 36343]|uniref:hypothetical protein n=1 Tax=Parasediminibacterium sp. JCM 36343 TaxID=3374279 RepID=UPI00397AD96E
MKIIGIILILLQIAVYFSSYYVSIHLPKDYNSNNNFSIPYLLGYNLIGIIGLIVIIIERKKGGKGADIS